MQKPIPAGYWLCKMKTSIVLGLQYGDEGKGLITSSLSNRNDLVVRFSGGHQAGHTVNKDGIRHIFSNFGSGTLNGAHTYWSEYCTFYPPAFRREELSLKNDCHVKPIFFIHPLAMVTTPFDIDHNRKQEEGNQHGSVGVGFGTTIARHTETPYKLFAIDLANENIMHHKLLQIAKYYGVENPEKQIRDFEFKVDAIQIEMHIKTLPEIIKEYQYSNIVFEGSQGILLDMDFGYFPHVTRSNTTSKNAMQIIKENGLPAPDLWYVMRSYATRHGNGPMPYESKEICFEDKTNMSHAYQGEFRQGHHQTYNLSHALKLDSIFSGNDYTKKNLAITCLNQTENMILMNGRPVTVREFLDRLGRKFNKVVLSRSADDEQFSLMKNKSKINY